MGDKLKDIEQYYSSYLEIDNKEQFEKVINEVYNDMGSLEAYNLLV